MIKPHFAPLWPGQNAFDSGLRRDDVAHSLEMLDVRNINMGYLVIADGEGRAGEGVKRLSKRSRTNVQETGPAEHAIDEDRSGHIAMPIFADDPDSCSHRSGPVQQRCASGVELTDKTGHIAARWTVALGVVIEVRQVNQREIGTIAIQNLGCRAGDPLGARKARARPPERMKGELAQAHSRADR